MGIQVFLAKYFKLTCISKRLILLFASDLDEASIKIKDRFNSSGRKNLKT